MPKIKFRIRLKDAHRDKGLSPYAVWKHTGIAQNTVRKYVDTDEVIGDYVPSVVVLLANFYGVDWRDRSIVEVIEVDEEDPENETLVAAIA